MEFFNNNFYPENFQQIDRVDEHIGQVQCVQFFQDLIGDAVTDHDQAQHISCTADGFIDIATAAVIGGRRSDFKGYIVINLSNYLEHDKEHYFKIALQFLSDMNDCWKYIFLVDNKNENASKTLVISTLQILLNDIPCEVKYENTFYNTDIIDTTLTEKNVTCSEPVKKLFNDMLKDEILSKDTISILIQNISGYYGPQISMRTIRHFFKNKDPVIKYMITKRQYDHLINMLQLGGEYTYEYKQEI